MLFESRTTSFTAKFHPIGFPSYIVFKTRTDSTSVALSSMVFQEQSLKLRNLMECYNLAEKRWIPQFNFSSTTSFLFHALPAGSSIQVAVEHTTRNSSVFYLLCVLFYFYALENSN